MQFIESIAFNRIILGEDARSDIGDRDRAEKIVNALRSEEPYVLQRFNLTLGQIEKLQKLVFMSHKTNDRAAEREARYISSKHNVAVYMAEWDGGIQNPNSLALPAYIMQAIGASCGFLVHVTLEIETSMWIGYEVGVAHARDTRRARITYNARQRLTLPAVVGALPSLDDRTALDMWIQRLP